MCGIFGAIGSLPANALDEVSRALTHRGPDAEGRFIEGDVSLLHRRLRIIDLSETGAQPMANEDGSIQVIFNGEIYNHKELRRELEQAGHSFRSRTSDTEAIVHGYERWGEGVVERLDGMFALAVWDRSKRKLLLARDRAGKKPLFYSDDPVFRFGSTVESLHASGLPTGVSLGQLPHYLAYGFVPPPATLHRGVQQLAPGTRLVWENGKHRTDSYWEPHFGIGGNGDGYAHAQRRIRDLVTAAVERRLESDVPLGAFLSGGMDSSIIVGLMAKLTGSRVPTFSIGFSEDARYDETGYARMAARAFNTDHTEFTLEPSSFELVETLVRHHDGPFGDSSAIPTYVVSQLTRQHVTVALTGDGGDELFCGYVRFLAAEGAERLPLLLRRAAASVAQTMPAGAIERTLLGRARRFLVASALPLDDRMASWNSYFLNPASVIRRDLFVDSEAPLAWQRRVFAQAQGTTTLARVLEHNFRTYLPFDLLVKADRTSMAHGLELRSPFLDTALVEYAGSLPPHYLRRGLQTKRILRDAFRDLLPEPILKRGKMGFGVPLGTWFRGSLRDYLHDHLGPGARVDGYLDRAALSQLLDEHARGAADHGHRLWALLTLEVWLRSLARQQLARAA
jgi:asparagine synthase (glutamine-hydrolysing)